MDRDGTHRGRTSVQQRLSSGADDALPSALDTRRARESFDRAVSRLSHRAATARLELRGVQT